MNTRPFAVLALGLALAINVQADSFAKKVLLAPLRTIKDVVTFRDKAFSIPALAYIGAFAADAVSTSHFMAQGNHETTWPVTGSTSAWNVNSAGAILTISALTFAHQMRSSENAPTSYSAFAVPLTGIALHSRYAIRNFSLPPVIPVSPHSDLFRPSTPLR